MKYQVLLHLDADWASETLFSLYKRWKNIIAVQFNSFFLERGPNHLLS